MSNNPFHHSPLARITFIFLSLVFTLSPPCNAADSADQKAKPELSLDIVPDSNGEDHRLLAVGYLFHVVLTNVSEKPINIYQDWSSWGYDTISFEAVAADGKIFKIVKDGMMEWSKNFPALFKIPPGGHYVFPVQFDPDKWSVLKEMKKSPMPHTFKVKAIFDEHEDCDKTGAWKGHIESKSESLEIDLGH